MVKNKAIKIDVQPDIFVNQHVIDTMNQNFEQMQTMVDSVIFPWKDNIAIHALETSLSGISLVQNAVNNIINSIDTVNISAIIEATSSVIAAIDGQQIRAVQRAVKNITESTAYSLEKGFLNMSLDGALVGEMSNEEIHNTLEETSDHVFEEKKIFMPYNVLNMDFIRGFILPCIAVVTVVGSTEQFDVKFWFELILSLASFEPKQMQNDN